jgi:hypothetical protein
MKSCDLSAGASKLDLALKTLRTTLRAVEEQWNDEAKRHFWESHIVQIDPSARVMFEAIRRMNEAIVAAERDCGDDKIT